MKPFFTHCLALILGVVATTIWFQNSNTNKLGVVADYISDVTQKEIKTNLLEPNKGVSTETPALTSSVVAQQEQPTAQDQKSDLLEPLFAENIVLEASNTESVEYYTEFTTLQDMLTSINVDMLGSDEMGFYLEDFNTWMKFSENPAREIYDYLSSGISENEKHVTQYMIAFSDGSALADDAISELAIAGETDYAAWNDILSYVTINTTNGRDSLLDVLPTITDPVLIGTSLRAMTPSMVPATERSEFLSNVAVYADHENEAVRSAVIESIGAWSAHDYSHVVAHELVNGTEKTQASAITAVGYANMLSNDVKNGLMNIIHDSNASFDNRLNAYNVLGRFPLDDAEYELQYEFYREHVKPLEELNNQG